MIIIEIILTIFAWRNGWKWLSLIPMGSAILIGFFIGLGAGMSGGDSSSLVGLFMFDIAAIIALIVMVSKKKISNEKNNDTNP